MNKIVLRNWLNSLRQLAFAAMVLGLPHLLTAQTNSNAGLVKLLPPAPRRPGIVLILADNIGYGDLGCYGQTKIKTPNLDKLAAGGIRFTSSYAGSPDDAVARAVLMTGSEARHLRAGFNELLPADAVTMAELLKKNGFHTGLIGEWNLGDTGPFTPDKKGFDEFAGFLGQNHAREYFSDRIRRHDPIRGDAEMVFSENEFGRRGLFLPDSLAIWAANFLQINKPDQFNRFRPFFLCLSYPTPYVSAELVPPSDARYSDAPWPPLERTRATLVSRMDDGVGKLLKQLAALNIETNTIVIFTSLAGPRNVPGMATEFFNSAGPLRGAQGSLYEGGLRVPMIVRWPARIKPGRVSDLLWTASDLLPTFAEVALAKPPDKIDGISVLPTLLGQRQKAQHEFLRWETGENGARLAARFGDWKAIRTNSTAAFELYNLRDDPSEKENLAAKNSAELRKIQKLLGIEQ